MPEPIFSPVSLLTASTEAVHVFRDVFKCYTTCYKRSGKLHEQISISSILFRRKNGLACGALGDLDLATISEPTETAFPLTRRLMDAPFIALDLLARPTITPQYRHDLESLFYTIIWYASRYEGGAERVKPPLWAWGYPRGDTKLSKAKFMFHFPVWGYQRLLTKEGRVFVWWLHQLQGMFANGMTKRSGYKLGLREEVDEETLGGLVSLDGVVHVVEEGVQVMVSDMRFQIADYYITQIGQIEKRYQNVMNQDYLCWLVGMDVEAIVNGAST